MAGFIDWDTAGPSSRELDLAFVALSWVPLYARRVAQGHGFTAFDDRSRRLHLLLDAYAYGYGGDRSAFGAAVVVLASPGPVRISPRPGVTAGPELRGKRVVLVPVTAEHVPELRRILRTPEVWLRWGDEATSPQWPFDDPSATRFAVLLDGAVRGMVQYDEEAEPAYRHASIDVFLDPLAHGRGIGRDTVGTLARHLVHDRGHHRLVIDPAADNEPAIRCYTAVGFRPVSILRRYERDADGTGWHDGLLMDLLAEELDQPR